MKRFLSFFIAAVTAMLSVTTWAAEVSKEEAATLASSFLSAKTQSSSARKAPSASTTKLTSTKFKTIELKDELIVEDQFFVLQNEDGEGWVIMASDDAIQPVLAYSETGSFDPDNMPDNLKWWLGMYSRQIDAAIKAGVTATAEVATEWSELRSGIRKAKAATVVGPLMTTQWDQGSPFNNLCPSNRYTGCVATAMSQVMNYWEWPNQGQGSKSYYDSESGTSHNVNFANTTYDWANMKDTYRSSTTAQKTAVATLMYHAGVSVEMGYGSDGSGAQTLPFRNGNTTQACAFNALWNYFKYDADSLKAYSRSGNTGNYTSGYSSWTDANWKAMLRAELDKGRPIMYSGYGGNSGHSFVCDGYDTSTDKFYFNWGWSGSYDGWFTVNSLNPGTGGAGSGSGTYNEMQGVIIGIVPNVSDKYKITYSVTNGTLSGSSTWTQSTVGQSTTLPNVTPAENYLFLGWTDLEGSKKANVGQAGDSYTPMRNLTLYAVVVPDGYVLNFISTIDLNAEITELAEQEGAPYYWSDFMDEIPSWSGHGTCEETSLREESKGAGIVLPSANNDPGWTFQRWIYMASNGSLYSAGYPGDRVYPYSDMNLYGYWTEDSKVWLDYTLTGAVQTGGTEDGWFTQADGISATFTADEFFATLTNANTTVTVKVGDETLDASNYTKSYSNGTLTLTVPADKCIDDVEVVIVATEDYSACPAYSATLANNNTYLGTGSKSFGTPSYTWTVSATGNTTTGFVNGKGERFGATSGTNRQCTSATFTTSSANNCLIQTITINASAGVSGTIQAFIGDTPLGDAQSLTTSDASYTFTNKNKLHGEDLKFVVTNTATSGNNMYYLYVRRINIAMYQHVAPQAAIQVAADFIYANRFNYYEDDESMDPDWDWFFQLMNTSGSYVFASTSYPFVYIQEDAAPSATALTGTHNPYICALFTASGTYTMGTTIIEPLVLTYKSTTTKRQTYNGSTYNMTYYIYHATIRWSDATGQEYYVDSDVYAYIYDDESDAEVTPTGDTDPRYYRADFYLQDVEGSGYTLEESVTATGESGATIEVPRNSYTGFYYPEAQTITLADNNTSTNPKVVSYYYDRRSYPISFIVNNMTVQRDTLRYMATPAYRGTTPTREATDEYEFTFNRWSPTIIPAKAPKTYTAVFDTLRSYTVTFNVNGHGTAPESQRLSEGSLVTRPADPSEAGYTFGGWYKEQGCATAWNFESDVVTANTILYAKWTANTHNLSWDANGGTLSGSYTSGTVAYGAAITAPTATRTGYTFAGWDGVVPATMPDNDLEFTAQWTPNTNTAYVVKHFQQNIADDNYTEVVADRENLTGTTGAEVTPAVKNYEGFTAPIAQTVAIAADGSLVVTYNYTRNKYALTWDANGGNISGNYTKGDVKYGASITAPLNANVTKTGSNFLGWNPSVIPATMPAEPLTFVAQWEVKTFSGITFTSEDENEGTVSVNPEKSEYTYGDNVTITATAAEGYEFSGWSDGNEEAERTITVTESTTSLTATFSPKTNISYTVRFWKQNLNDDEYTEQLPAEYRTGTTGTLTNAADVAKVYDGFEQLAFEEKIIAGDGSTVVDIYYNRLTFQIRFLVEGIEKQRETLRYDATPVFKGETPAKAADAQYTYTFNGWDPAIAKVSQAQDYNAKFSTTLNKYTVSFNANGHGTAPVPQSIGYGLLASEPSALSEVGYTFGGWYKEAACTNAWNFASDVVEGNVELFAKWTVNSHNLAWELNGGTITSAAGEYTAAGSVAFGTTLVAPVVEQTGFNFVGWDPSVPATMPDEDVIYVATWQEKGDIVYKVRHELQNIEDDNFTLDVEEEFSGTTGASVTPLRKTYEGFTAPAAQTANILADGSLTIIYQYIRNKYTLAWDVNGGDALNEPYSKGELKFGASIIAPADPEWKGHTFHGWNPAAPATMPANDVTCVAQWTTDTYNNISFNSSDETMGTVTASPDKDSYSYGEEVTVTADANEGYSFDGWSNGETSETITVVVDENTGAIVANFKPNTDTKYIVRHLKEALTGEFVQEGADEELRGTTGADVTPEPLTFEGFTTPSAQTKKIAADGSLVIEYRYVRNSYSLTWNANGGEFTNSGYTEGQVKYEAEIIPAQVARKGYEFLGWGAEVPSKMPAGSLAFKAQWNAETFSNVNIPSGAQEGGTVTVSPDKDEYSYDETVTITATPDEGYEFDGWSNGETSQTIVVTIAGDTTITATFTPKSGIKYVIRRFLQNIEDDNFTLLDEQELSGTTGESIQPAAPELEGFTAPEVEAQTIAGNGSTVFVFNYIRNKYTLSWDANGGQLLDNGRTEGEVKYGAEIKAAEAEKKGHIFLGWGADVPATMPSHSLSFLAQWEAETFDGITFTSEDETKGTVTVNPAKDEYSYGDEVTISAEANEGYTFSGWSDGSTDGAERTIVVDENTESIVALFEANTNTKYTVRILLQNIEDDEFTLFAEQELSGTTGAEVSPVADPIEGFTAPDAQVANILGNGSLVIEYKYLRNSYTLTWDTDGGEFGEGEFTQGLVKYGAEIIAPADPTKPHFTFLGWDNIIPETMPAEDLTLTAQWEEDKTGIEIVVDGRTILSDQAIRIYDFNGRDVTELNGSLGNGLYIVTGGGQATKVAIFQ
ncbi:MAG: InlB B-repeat-containing protein [Paludibacteraceae bacterium]|nr:InlB B-repeat-containing protein [Paludibacteraceae bacterium]